jgi:hypothetical protein
VKLHNKIQPTTEDWLHQKLICKIFTWFICRRDSFEPTKGNVYTMTNWLVRIMAISPSTFTYSAPKAEAFKQESLMQHLVQGGNHCCPPERVGICFCIQRISTADHLQIFWQLQNEFRRVPGCPMVVEKRIWGRFCQFLHLLW